MSQSGGFTQIACVTNGGFPPFYELAKRHQDKGDVLSERSFAIQNQMVDIKSILNQKKSNTGTLFPFLQNVSSFYTKQK